MLNIKTKGGCSLYQLNKMETLNITFHNTSKDQLTNFLNSKMDKSVNQVKSFEFHSENSSYFTAKMKFTSRMGLWLTAYEWGQIQLSKPQA